MKGGSNTGYCNFSDFGGVYLHRGLSLMECLTLWLVMRHKST